MLDAQTLEAYLLTFREAGGCWWLVGLAAVSLLASNVLFLRVRWAALLMLAYLLSVVGPLGAPLLIVSLGFLTALGLFSEAAFLTFMKTVPLVVAAVPALFGLVGGLGVWQSGARRGVLLALPTALPLIFVLFGIFP